MQIENVSGKIIGERYQFIEVLGKGGVGITYAAIDLHTQEKVAIKAVSLKQLDDWKQIELLEREAKVLAQLNHPAIPKYLDYFQVDSEKDRIFYIVQQLVSGKSLFQLVEEGWRTTEVEVKAIASQILEIFIYLHSLQPPVIHRDIKPHNLIRSDRGEIFLVDFGAVQNTYYNTLMRGSTVVGTFGYMAPEQFQGKAQPATDLYGLGATILYLLTHRSPAELPHDTLKINFRSQVNISAGFANWLEKLLQPDLEDRFTSAKDALDGLSDRYLLINTIRNKWKVLIDKGANVNVTNGEIITPLFKATSSGDLEIIKLLIDRGADINARNNSGQTPLFWAVVYKRQAAIKLLLDRGADVNAKDNYGKTPLYEAIANTQKEIVKLLLDRGKNINTKDSNIRNLLSIIQSEQSNNDVERKEIIEFIEKYDANKQVITKNFNDKIKNL
jgi:serine/threonine protein kinase